MGPDSSEAEKTSLDSKERPLGKEEGIFSAFNHKLWTFKLICELLSSGEKGVTGVKSAEKGRYIFAQPIC